MQIILNNDKNNLPWSKRRQIMSGLKIVATFFVMKSALLWSLLTEHMQPGTTENMIAVVSRLRNQAASEVMLWILELIV